MDNSRSESCQSNDLVHLEHHSNFDIFVRTFVFLFFGVEYRGYLIFVLEKESPELSFR